MVARLEFSRTTPDVVILQLEIELWIVLQFQQH